MNWTKRIVIAAFLTCFGAPAVTAQTAPDVAPIQQFEQGDVSQVRLLLMGYHDIADRSEFEAVPNARQIVESLARGPHGVLKDRALAALGRHWPSADVFLLYSRVLAADDTPEGLRHRLLIQFATSFGERSMPTVAAYLNDSDWRLQITAVQALAQIGTDDAFERIDVYADQLDDELMLEQVDRVARTIR